MNSTGKKSPGLVNSLLGALRQFWKREDGVSVAIVGMSMVALMGSAALGMDVGRAYGVQRWLQSSADAAAVSGAGYINDGAANVTVYGSSVAHSIGVAYRYSVDSGEYNAKSGIVSSTVSGYPALVCLAGLNIPCVGSPTANALRVKLSATVPMYFGKVVGVNSMTVQAMATAQIGGSKAKPYNVMFIVDNTASMASTDANCSNVTKIKCAQNGVLALLKYLNTQNDSVGLMSYPELANPSKATKENTCPSTVMSVANGDIAPYANTSASEDGGTNPTGWVSDATYPTYLVVAPENTYLTAATTPTLNTTDNIVMAMGGGSCAGMTGPGGEGTFFADAITSAQYYLSQLKANGTATQKTAQNVIIILTDGAATASTAQFNANNVSKQPSQCGQAVTAAQAATAAGTWVYTIGYAAGTTGCTTDSGTYASPCQTLKDMASNLSRFYSDATAGCPSANNPITTLSGIFQQVARSLQPPRLVPNETT